MGVMADAHVFWLLGFVGSRLGVLSFGVVGFGGFSFAVVTEERPLAEIKRVCGGLSSFLKSAYASTS